MPNDHEITPENIKKWRAEADEHQRQAAQLVRRAFAAEQFLATLEPKGRDATDVADNFMGAIRQHANTALKPIPKPELKAILVKQGFPEKQVGSTYFYVAIKKLADKGQISVNGKGEIWKGKNP
jgi:hypothetical protein